MGKILIGLSFFKWYSVTLDLKNNLVHFPEVSLQLKKHYGKFNCGALDQKTLQKDVVGPLRKVMVPTITATELDTSFEVTAAHPAFTRKSDFIMIRQWTILETQEKPLK